MNPIATIPETTPAIVCLADGREVRGFMQISDIKGFGQMVWGYIGQWFDKDAGTWKEQHESYPTRVDCDGLRPVGWKALAEGNAQ